MVVAITGSVGKTTAKEQIAGVLRTRHSVRASPGNRNSRMGVAASILGLPNRRVPGTQAVFGTWSALRSLAPRASYPGVLVARDRRGTPGRPRARHADGPPQTSPSC